MPTFNVLLEGAASAYDSDELPEPGEIINVGGVQAEVEEVTTGADGKALIIARRPEAFSP